MKHLISSQCTCCKHVNNGVHDFKDCTSCFPCKLRGESSQEKNTWKIQIGFHCHVCKKDFKFDEVAGHMKIDCSLLVSKQKEPIIWRCPRCGLVGHSVEAWAKCMSQSSQEKKCQWGDGFFGSYHDEHNKTSVSEQKECEHQCHYDMADITNKRIREEHCKNCSLSVKEGNPGTCKDERTKDWEERFDAMIFSKKQGYGDQILYREKEIKAFISNEISLAVKKERAKMFDEKYVYWDTKDSDEDYDGYLHIVSTIDGREIKISILELLKDLGVTKEKKQ